MITLVHHASVMCGAHGADQNCTIYVNLQCKSSLCWLRLAAFGDKSSSSVWSSSTWLESAESVAAVLQDHLSKTVPEPGAIWCNLMPFINCSSFRKLNMLNAEKLRMCVRMHAHACSCICIHVPCVVISLNLSQFGILTHFAQIGAYNMYDNILRICMIVCVSASHITIREPAARTSLSVFSLSCCTGALPLKTRMCPSQLGPKPASHRSSLERGLRAVWLCQVARKESCPWQIWPIISGRAIGQHKY